MDNKKNNGKQTRHLPLQQKEDGKDVKPTRKASDYLKDGGKIEDYPSQKSKHSNK